MIEKRSAGTSSDHGFWVVILMARPGRSLSFLSRQVRDSVLVERVYIEGGESRDGAMRLEGKEKDKR